MAQYLWQTSLTASAWKEQLSGNIAALIEAGDADAANFGGEVSQAWIAFGEYDMIAIVEMPDNESMAAYVLAMIANGHFSAGKTTILLSADEAAGALKRAGASG